LIFESSIHLSVFSFDALRTLRFAFRQKLAWRRGIPRLIHEEKQHLFSYLDAKESRELEETEMSLRERYRLDAFAQASSVIDYRDNLSLLAALVELEEFLELPEKKISSLDIGSKNWNYVYGLKQFLKYACHGDGRQIDLCGVEVDGYGVYRDLYSRCDHAQAYVEQANGDGDRVEYRVDDFVTSHYGKMDIVTLFYPFLLEEALRSWGLPRRYFQPRNLLAKALSLLDVRGALIVTNQTGLEAERLNSHLEALNALVVAQVPMRFKLVHYWEQTHDRVISLIQKS
jgi:hypothetical protein